MAKVHVTFGTDKSLLVVSVRDHYDPLRTAVAFFDDEKQVRALSVKLASMAEEMPDGP